MPIITAHGICCISFNMALTILRISASVRPVEDSCTGGLHSLGLLGPLLTQCQSASLLATYSGPKECDHGKSDRTPSSFP